MNKDQLIEDYNREGLNWGKILQAFKLFLPKNTRTLIRLERFTDLDINEIKKLTKIIIRGIILDIDSCVAFNHQSILPENLRHIQKLLDQGIRIVVYSNMQWTKRYQELPPAVKVLTRVDPKPNPQVFQTACKNLDLPKENIAMVGDNYLTDGGAIALGIHFIHIKPLRAEKENIFEKIHAALRSFFIALSRFHDNFR